MGGVWDSRATNVTFKDVHDQLGVSHAPTGLLALGTRGRVQECATKLVRRWVVVAKEALERTVSSMRSIATCLVCRPAAYFRNYIVTLHGRLSRAS
jgi:hypothetical protein